MTWIQNDGGGIVVPIMTDLVAAPESLLKFVWCKCKLIRPKVPVEVTYACSCRKWIEMCHGLRRLSWRKLQKFEENVGSDEEDAFHYYNS